MDASSFRVATPCQVPWSSMKGDDRVRHCAQCNLDVINIGKLTTHEAEEVLQRARCGIRTCVTFYRRFDGTVLTRDCEGGLRKAWREAKRRRQSHPVLAGLGYLGIVLLTVFVVGTLFGDNIRRLAGFSVGGALAGNEPTAAAPVRAKHTMGSISQNNAY